MKNIESIFNFYLKNKINPINEAQKVFAAMLAINDYDQKRDFDLQTVIKMIMIDGSSVEELTNKKEIKRILDKLLDKDTNESKEVQKCKDKAKILNSKGIEEDINELYGRLLISVAIDIESNLKLDFSRLYERIIKITFKELENEKNIRLKYCYHNIYDVTEEYAFLISFLEENIRLKIKESKEESKQTFNQIYEEQKGFYKHMPILSGVLEKTKKL